MKTLADLKRAIRPGVKLEGFSHVRNKDMGIRPVSIVKSNEFSLMTVYNGNPTDSWVPFPKAKDIVFNEDGSFTFLHSGVKLSTFKIV